MSYGPDLRYGDQVAASYVEKILKGAKPTDLPVEQVSRVEPVINSAQRRLYTLPFRLRFSSEPMR